MKVVVFQCPCGTAARQRSPRLDRPRSLAILVEAPRLVDEDQLVGIEVELSVEPGLPGLEDILALLLRRVSGLFFERQALPVEKGPDRGDPDRETALARQPLGNLGERDVLRAFVDQPEDEVRVRVEPGAARLALPTRPPLRRSPGDASPKRSPSIPRRRTVRPPAVPTFRPSPP